LKTLVDISRALSNVENRKSGYIDLLDSLYKKGKPAKVIGITGSPGVGKSTLVDSYIKVLVQKGKKVAVIAVDPSSPFSGGAILGDRIRMNSSSDDVFIRSVATRGAMGGISDAVFNMIVVFRAAGYEYILVETVGVGQNEISISKLSDITVLVLNPASGDDIQMMKAGIMETGDVFVINKSELAGTDELETYLKSSFPEAGSRVVRTSARTGKGVKEFSDLIDKIYETDKQQIKDKSKLILKEGLRTLMLHEASKRVEAMISQADVKLDEIVEAKISPYEEMKRLLSEV
jgi:LAO/AO transport system kinase